MRQQILGTLTAYVAESAPVGSDTMISITCPVLPGDAPLSSFYLTAVGNWHTSLSSGSVNVTSGSSVTDQLIRFTGITGHVWGECRIFSVNILDAKNKVKATVNFDEVDA